jgi:MFS transporter, DHA2 family, multidrug resistance protein
VRVPPASPRASFRDWIAVIGSVLGTFMAVLDILITNSSLQDIQGSLAASLDEGSWISTGYLVAETVIMPLTGWLATVFSLRLYLAGSAGLFVLFSILCGLSTSLTEMILFRVGQGLTGGALIPASMTIVLTRLPERQRPIGLALWGITASLAPAVGPAIGGWLTDTYNWRYIFYINVLPGFALVALILYGLAAAPLRLNLLSNGDWSGIIATAIGLGSLEIVLEEGQRRDWLGSELIRICVALACISLAAAILIELIRKEPFINLRLLLRRNFGAACVCSLAVGIGVYSLPFILPLYLAQVQGYNAVEIGRLMLWQGLPQLLVIPLLTMLMLRIDVRLIVAFGFAVFATTSFMNAYMSHDSGGEQLRLALVGRAIGGPFIMTALSSLLCVGLAPNEMPHASSLYNILRNLGGSIGIALISTFTTYPRALPFLDHRRADGT